jgi:tetratricopeptide (TPR) repeat protein
MTDIESLENQAVDAAVAQKWEDAAALNKKILDIDANNVDANLRMGFAMLQLEKIKEAKKYYQKALKLQPKSPVALENLDRISILEESSGGKKPGIGIKATLDPSLFLEIPGKTRSVTLVNLGQKNHLAELDIGEKVDLKLRKRKIEIRTMNGDFIGYLPDDVSKRIIFFIEAKSEYSAHVKEANSTKVVIFVKEEKKGAKVAHYSSFPSKTAIITTPRDRDEDDEDNDEDEEEGQDEWSKIVGAADQDDEPKEDFSVDHDDEEESEE